MGPLVAAALLEIWMGAEDVEDTGIGVEVTMVVAGSVVVGGGGVKVETTVYGMVEKTVPPPSVAV